MHSLHLKIVFLSIVLMLSVNVNAQYKIEVLDTNSFVLEEGVVLSKTSFRGLSVVDDQTIWVSGSSGTVAHSTDDGKTFVFKQLKGYEKSDFRDIEAFDHQRAIIMSSGTPALILKTVDGGQTWKEVFRQNDSAYFLDAMDFWDEKRGILVGDPINGHFVLLQTNDGGDTWQELDTTQTPKAMDGEAVFAASGTSLRCWGDDRYGFVTGGSTSRLFYQTITFDTTNPKPNDWKGARNSSIQRGKSSQGAFSFTLHNQKIEGMLVVGGDYLNDTSTEQVSAYLALSSHLKYTHKKVTGGYRSCVEKIIESKDDQSRILLAVGTSGVDVLSLAEWKMISAEPFHVVRKAKKGKAVFFAGPKGKIGKLIY